VLLRWWFWRGEEGPGVVRDALLGRRIPRWISDGNYPVSNEILNADLGEEKKRVPSSSCSVGVKHGVDPQLAQRPRAVRCSEKGPSVRKVHRAAARRRHPVHPLKSARHLSRPQPSSRSVSKSLITALFSNVTLIFTPLSHLASSSPPPTSHAS
jgi:hypothetical protein